MGQPYRSAADRSGAPTAPPERYRPVSRKSRYLGRILQVAPAIAAIAWWVVEAVHERAAPPWVLPAAIMWLVGVLAWRRLRYGGAFQARFADAVRRLDAGDADGAIAAYEELLDRARGAPITHAIILMQLALAMLRKGKNEQALAILHAVRESEWLERQPVYYLLAAAIAGAHLNMGEIEDAARWQRVAHGRVPLVRRAHLVVLDALLDARRGRFADLTERFDRTWSEVVAEMAGKPYPMKVLRILRAFALEKSADGARAHEVETLVDEARKAPGELSQHTATWPELRVFLEAHGVQV